MSHSNSCLFALWLQWNCYEQAWEPGSAWSEGWYHPPLCLRAGGKCFLTANLYLHWVIVEQAKQVSLDKVQGMQRSCHHFKPRGWLFLFISLISFNSPYGPNTDPSQQAGGTHSFGAAGQKHWKSWSALGNSGCFLVDKNGLLMQSFINLYTFSIVQCKIWDLRWC